MASDNIPVGPELDRAAALAMGWKPPHEYGRCNRCGWPYARADLPAAYSTDPARIDEMLTWLSPAEPDSAMGGIYLSQLWHSGPTRCSWTASIGEYAGAAGRMDREPRHWRAHGATIPEALARLVLAVKEAGDD